MHALDKGLGFWRVAKSCSGVTSWSSTRLSPTAAAATTTATVAAAAATATTILARLGFVHCQPPASMLLIVQGVNRGLSSRIRPHFHKAKPSASARLPINHHLCASHLAKRGEQVFKVGIGNRKRKIADIQLLAHLQPPGSERSQPDRDRNHALSLPDYPNEFNQARLKLKHPLIWSINIQSVRMEEGAAEVRPFSFSCTPLIFTTIIRSASRAIRSAACNGLMPRA
jgi:hypothetical protein